MRSARGKSTDKAEAVYTLRVPRSLLEEFRALAAQNERTIAQELRVLIYDYVENARLPT